jgi:hypothetical protein
MRALRFFLGPAIMIKAYADDIVIVVQDLFADVHRIQYVFKRYAEISGLLLNTNKCVIIPLWLFDEQAVRGRISILAPEWCNILIESFGRYLGFTIGPGAHNQDWQRVMPQLVEMTSKIYSLALPKKTAVMLYHMFALSKTQFIAQLRIPTLEALKAERAAVKKIIGGANNWVSPSDFRAICSALSYPSISDRWSSPLTQE